MFRASMLAVTLVALPASAFDWEKWVDKQVDKVMEEGRQDQVKALSSRKVEERIEAVKFFSGLRDQDSIGYVTRALSDPDARVRETAASGLWRIEKDAEPARAQLTAALDDPDPNVVARAAGALQALGVKEKDLVAPRRRVLGSREASDSSRFLAARGLIGEEPPIRLLYPMLTYLQVGGNAELSGDALERLVKKTQDRSLIEPLVAEAQKAGEGQAILVRTVGFFKPKPDRWAETLAAVVDSKQPGVAYAALGEMRDLKLERDVRVWAPRAGDMLRHPDSSVRSQALWALGGAGGLAASEADKVVAALGDKDKSVRKGAASALGEMGESKQAVPAAYKARVAAAARPALKALMERESDKDVYAEAKEALEKMGPAGTLAVAPPEATAIASAGPVVPDYSGTAKGSEAGGMAVLRARDVKFEPEMFFRALNDQDTVVVRAFLDAGMSPKDALLDRGPPIRIMFFGGGACDAGDRPTKAATKEILKLLLDRGADVNGSDKYGNTALSEAASSGCDREVMRTLIKAGAKVNATNVSGLTAFEMGLDSGHDGLEELIAAGYRLPAAKVKDYTDAYKKNPASVAMIKKATRK